MSLSESDPSFKAQYARLLTEQRVLQELAAIKPEHLPPSLRRPANAPPGTLPERTRPDVTGDPTELKVCIVGAGVAGLYTAHILGELGFQYDLFEASDRAGGRVYTHYFSDKVHDYYDIGAMRFPDTPIMKRTFDLFKTLDVPLKPYYMESFGANQCKNQPSRYNDITKVLSGKEEQKVLEFDPTYDPFGVSVANNGPVPDETVKNPLKILDDAYALYRHKIKVNPQEGFRYLMRHDKYSLHDYLNFVEDLDYESINWLETLTSATGWFDMAFSENVMEDLAFEYSKDTINPDKSQEDKWWCVDGGTEVLTKKMRDDWKIKIKYLRRVTRIALDVDITGEDKMIVKHVRCKPIKQPVTAGERTKDLVDEEIAPKEPVTEESVTERYASVINTTTLAALRQMDLTRLGLSYATKTAIRSLHYDTSTKVGIKFKKAWWMKHPYKIRGGLGKTDMPLRVCVYPSYNIDDDKDQSAVLLCSYTWGQDSERIASMINKNSPENEDQLRNLLLSNLAHLHDYNNNRYEEILAEITSLYETHHAFDWSTDPYAAGGAFALFGPGQFSKLYPHLIRPSSDGRFHIVGEHASCHHAWIAGALNSAYRGVYMFLERFGLWEKQKELKDKFGVVHELDYDTAFVQMEIGRMEPSKQPKIPV